MPTDGGTKTGRGSASFHCRWCGKTRKPSGWEQKVLGSDEYAPLCRSCARRRLYNPWNALLALRKVAE